MSAMVLTTTTLFTLWTTPTSSAIVEGHATYYAQHVMERVVANRRVDLDGYAGAIAMNRAADLKRTAWLEHKGTVTGPYLVVDCAQLVHFQARLDHGYVVEVDFKTARDWGMVDVGPVPVRVHFQDPGGTYDGRTCPRSYRSVRDKRTHLPC